MRRLAILIPALLIGAFALADSTALVRVYTFGDSGHGFTRNDFEASFESANSGTYTVDSGQTMTVNDMVADPRLARGLYEEGSLTGYAWQFDGSNDYLSCTDGSCSGVEPAGDFSILVAWTPYSVTGLQTLTAKWNGGAGQASYIIEMNGDDLQFRISDDGTDGGGTNTTLAKANVLAIGVKHVAVMSFDFVADGTSDINIWVDEETVATELNSNGPAYGGTADFTIGAAAAGGNPLYGEIEFLGVKDGVAVGADEAQLTIRHYRGMTDQAGLNTVSVTSASPPMARVCATGACEPMFVPQPANSATIGPTGAYSPKAITNILTRPVFESWAAGAPTGWTESGGGTWTIDQETGTMAEGLSSAKFDTGSAGGDQATLTSACVDITAGDDYYVSVFLKDDGSATNTFDIIFDCYTGNDCTGGAIADIDLVTDSDLTSAWARYGGFAATDATCESFYLVFREDTQDSIAYLDAVTVSSCCSGSVDAYCGSDTDSSTACSASVLSIANPFAGHAAHLELQMTIQTAWAGNDGVTHALWNVPGTAGSNNRLYGYKHSTNTLYTAGYDESGNWFSAFQGGIAWAADTPVVIVHQKTSDGILRGWIDGTKLSTTNVAGAEQDNSSATMYIGSDGTTGGGFWILDLSLRRRMSKEVE